MISEQDHTADNNDTVHQALIPYVRNPIYATSCSFLPFECKITSDFVPNRQLETYYKLTYTVVSLIFLSPFVGFTLASLCNDLIHMKFGQRGISILGPSCHVIVYVVLAVHPPYPVLVVVFVAAGFGNGLMDAAWCAWIGNMASANRVSGFLQACYSLGATLSPLIATAMVTKAQLPWYYFYYLMVRSLLVILAFSGPMSGPPEVFLDVLF